MKYWVADPYLEVDISVLSQIQQFATSIQSSGRTTELARQLCSVTNERVWFWCFFYISYCLIVGQNSFALIRTHHHHHCFPLYLPESFHLPIHATSPSL